MPISISLSRDVTRSYIRRACRQRQSIELATTLDACQQRYFGEFLGVSDEFFSVVMPPELVAYEHLLWRLPVHISFESPEGWCHLQTTTPGSSWTSDEGGEGRALHLSMPRSLKLAKDASYLYDSFALDERGSGTFRFVDREGGRTRTFGCVVEYLASGGAACTTSEPLPPGCGPGLLGSVSLVLPHSGAELRLRCAIDEILQLGRSNALLLVAFEQASRNQTHRDNMAALAEYLQRWWLPAGVEVSHGPRSSAGGASFADGARAVRAELRDPVARHLVATIRKSDGASNVEFHTRLLRVGAQELVIQHPAGHSESADALRVGTAVSVSFAYDGQRVGQFSSVITGLGECNVSEVGRLGGLVLRLPERVDIRQQRRSFRATTAVWPPTEVLVWPGEPGDWPGVAGRRRRVGNAILRDISSSGAGLQAKQTPAGTWDAAEAVRDQMVAVAIYLEQDELPLLSAARVRHVSREPEGGYVIIGMEFLGLDATVEGRSVKRRIERFAARMQRHRILHSHNLMGAATGEVAARQAGRGASVASSR